MSILHTASWTPATWAAAAAPARPYDERLIYGPGVITSPATAHHALKTGPDLWHVDYLPGRHLTRSQARLAIRIAAALHDDANATANDIGPAGAEWSKQLGLTPLEAIGYARMTPISTPDQRERRLGK